MSTAKIFLVSFRVHVSDLRIERQKFWNYVVPGVENAQKCPKNAKIAKKRLCMWFLNNFVALIKDFAMIFFADSDVELIRNWCSGVEISNFIVLEGCGYPKWPPLGQKMLFWGPKKIFKIFFKKFIPKHDVWYQNQPYIICRSQVMAIQKLEVRKNRQNLKCP